MKRFRPILSLLATLALNALLNGCAMTKGTFMEGATDSQASGKVLAVRGTPETLGHKRLGYHSLVYPALAGFLDKTGYPDYIIEDHGLLKRQIVMFYLKTNHAYLMELETGITGHQSTVRGPEPIGKKTREVLDALDRLERATNDVIRIQKQGTASEH